MVMTRLRRYSRLDMALVALALVGGFVLSSGMRTNANMEGEQVKLEARVKASEVNLSELERAADLDALRQSIQQLQSLQTKTDFLSEVQAMEFGDRIVQRADENKVTIITWSSVYAEKAIQGIEYHTISHNLQVEGTADALISYVEALKQSTVPVVQQMELNVVNAKDGLWRLRVELIIYYYLSGV
ncbi:MAG: hypothetical protein HYX81_04635 [Chloroflexi bacterium]|nr:hypothetical protein [Chloroflexota bacterium]